MALGAQAERAEAPGADELVHGIATDAQDLGGLADRIRPTLKWDRGRRLGLWRDLLGRHAHQSAPTPTRAN